MALRVLAVLACVVLPAAALLVRDGVPPFILPALAAGLALPILFARRKSAFAVLIAAGLAALSASTTGEAGHLVGVTNDLDAWPRHDLTEGPLPDSADGFLVIRGHYRTEWTLDEYRTRGGERPDQNQDAAAVLVPLLGSVDNVVAPEGRIVIARVLDAKNLPRGATEVRGQLQPLADGILSSLVTFDAALSTDQVEGVLLDTTKVPTRQQAITQAAIAFIASLIALALLWLAIRDQPEGQSTSGSGEGEQEA